MCADINGDGARQTAAQIGARGARRSAAASMSPRARGLRMVRQPIAAFGDVQFQFNSAGAALRRSNFLISMKAVRRTSR